MRLVAGAGILLLALTSCRTLPPAPAVRAGEARTPAARFAFYPESAAADAAAVKLPVSGVEVRIAATPVLRAEDVVRVEVVPAELGKCLVFQVTPHAADELSRLGPEHRRVVLMVNGTAYGARRVDETLRDGSVDVYAEVPEPALAGLAAELRGGLRAADHAGEGGTR